MLEVKCNYCDWIGQEPTPAEYETEEEYNQAYQYYLESHKCNQ